MKMCLLNKNIMHTKLHKSRHVDHMSYKVKISKCKKKGIKNNSNTAIVRNEPS